MRTDVAEQTTADGDLSEIASRLRLVVGRLYRRFRQDAPGPLSHAQLTLLAGIARSGPVRLGDLAASEDIGPSSLTRSVELLDSRGLVKRRVSPADRRVVVVDTTDAGAALLAELWQTRTTNFAERMMRLPPEDYEALVRGIASLEALLAE